MKTSFLRSSILALAIAVLTVPAVACAQDSEILEKPATREELLQWLSYANAYSKRLLESWERAMTLVAERDRRLIDLGRAIEGIERGPLKKCIEKYRAAGSSEEAVKAVIDFNSDQMVLGAKVLEQEALMLLRQARATLGLESGPVGAFFVPDCAVAAGNR